MQTIKGITGYARVSSKRQSEEGLSLEHQTAEIKRYAAQRGLPVTNIYIEAISGRNHSNRKQFLQALSECKATGNLLCCWRLDRLSRSAALLMELEQSRVKFHCISQPDLSPLVVGILGSICQDESRQLGLRVAGSLKVLKEQCQAQGIPFFKAQGDALRKAQPKSIAVIKQNAVARRVERLPAILSIFETAGKRSYSETARILTSLGVKTLTGKGEAWSPMQVRRLVLG